MGRADVEQFDAALIDVQGHPLREGHRRRHQPDLAPLHLGPELGQSQSRVQDLRGGQLVRDDRDRGTEHAVAERVIAMVVRVDDRLHGPAGQPLHLFGEAGRAGARRDRVDQNRAGTADQDSGVVHAPPAVRLHA